MHISSAIQVCLSIGDITVREREIRGLQALSKELGTEELIVITRDEEPAGVIREKNIRVVPFYRWVLER